MTAPYDEHLSDDVLWALARGTPSGTPEAGAHFIKCQVCQKRLTLLSPREGRRALDSLRPLIEELKALQQGELAQRLRAICVDKETTEYLLPRALESGDVTLLRRLDPITTGAVLIAACGPYRLKNPRGLLAICLHILKALTAQEFLRLGPIATDILAQVEVEAGNAFRILGSRKDSTDNEPVDFFEACSFNCTRPGDFR